MPATKGGVEALKAFGIDANPLPCSVLIINPQGELCNLIGAGSTPRQVYDFVKAAGGAKSLPSFKEFKRWPITAKLKGGPSVHMGIEAKVGSARAFIDLTSHQFARGTATSPPLLAYTGEGLPMLKMQDGTVIRYLPSAKPDKDFAAAEKYFGPSYKIIATDLIDLMKVALDHNLDERAFLADVAPRRRLKVDHGPDQEASLWIG
jgi:hypothetical protein